MTTYATKPLTKSLPASDALTPAPITELTPYVSRLYVLKTAEPNRAGRIWHEKHGWLSVVFTSWAVAARIATYKNSLRPAGSLFVFATNVDEIVGDYVDGRCAGYWLVSESNSHDSYPHTDIVLFSEEQVAA